MMRATGLVSVSLIVLACCADPARACTFYVNSNADNDVVDNVLTLREAITIADGDHFNGNHIGTCRTLAELNQVPGANYVVVPPGPICGVAETRYTILLPPDFGANCGNGIGDNILFDTNIGSIAAAGGYFLGPHDTIDGIQPNGFAVSLVGPGPGSGSGITFGVGDTVDNWNVQVSHLAISNFGLDGISADGCQNASLVGLTLANNGRHGLFVDGNRCVTTKIGDVGADQRNFIYANAGDGIHIEGIANGDPAQNNLIRNNWVGLDGVSAFDASGNAGVGIAIINSLGNTVGGGGTNESNAIAKNGGYGLWLNGSRSSSNIVRGNLIGSSPDLDIGSFPNYRGIQIDGGANNNTIGGSGAGEVNVVSGNANHGIYISGGGTDTNTIQYNIIGLNRARGYVVPNLQDGVAIGGGPQQTSVHDNIIAGNSRWGIYQGGSGTSATTISNNVIGLRGNGNNANDNTASANGLGGIWLDSTPSNTVGPGNRIAGNNGPGVQVSGESADADVVKGNTIGLDNAGASKANTGGVYVVGGPDNTVIGGTSATDGNIISGNTGSGIRVNGNTIDGTLIRHNFVGTDATGNAAHGNSGEGIHIEQGATNTHIVQNLVNANGNDGIKLETGTAGSYVILNQIGVSNSGTVALPNAASGISMLSGANNNSIGDPVTPFVFNIIASHNSAGGAGIFVADPGTASNVIAGNIVGSAGFPNNYGIYVTNGATGTQIKGNAISDNSKSGVAIVGTGTTGNPITDNQIFDNGGLGIDLGADGVTANDLKDGDSGPNGLQNHPLLRDVVIGVNSVTLTAQLNSTPFGSFDITLYRSNHCDPSGYGEGQAVLGKVTIGADINGDAGASGLMYSVPNSLAQASWATATATNAGNTSEFSACAGISDHIFGSGFDSAAAAGVAAASGAAAAAAIGVATGASDVGIEGTLEALGDRQWQLSLRIDNHATHPVPAQVVGVTASAAVIVRNMQTSAGACSLAGRIECRLPALESGEVAAITLRLGALQDEPFAFSVQSESAGRPLLLREFRTAPATTAQ